MFNKMYQRLNNRRWTKRLLWSTVICILLCAPLTGFANRIAAAHNQFAPTNDGLQDNFAALENQLEGIRQALKIPGMSAAVVKEQELVWAAGFGYADIEKQVPATPNTPYELASVTKPVAATIIMQLVEAGLVDLDAPLRKYGVNQLGDEITVRHLLTHTSEGIPGKVHEYNGSRYGLLGGVMEGASGQTFAALLSQNILLPAGMTNTALNPYNRWGGIEIASLEDFSRILGIGAGFEHYPDVYQRLAEPYQFDGQYNIVPGMFFLYHNPGAGLISTVNDLARFDIALDQGTLLDETLKKEMLSPAVSTYQYRSDLQYGLGWYVQQFEGLRMLWHSGRWAPSTSALYLKIPEKDLTFVVLANTDNLTVPFKGIGEGDISQSTLFLAFFRNLVFSAEYGTDLPEIDWSASEGDLLATLSQVDNETVRKFLERELWSYRQAFSSSGQFDQVEKLNRVRLRDFPRSYFGRGPFYTNTAGLNPVVATTVHASDLVLISKVMAIWICILLASSLWMSGLVLFGRDASGWNKILWVMSALLVGPAALVIYRASLRKPDGDRLSPWLKAWSAAARTIPIYAVAWSVALVLLTQCGENPHPLQVIGLTYFVPLLAVIVLVRIPLHFGRSPEKLWRTLPGSLAADIATANLAYAVFLPLVMLFSIRVLTALPYPSSPFFWGMIIGIVPIALIVQVPLQRWLGQRGYGLDPAPGQAETSRNSLKPAFAGTLSLLVLSMALTIIQMG